MAEQVTKTGIRQQKQDSRRAAKSLTEHFDEKIPTAECSREKDRRKLGWLFVVLEIGQRLFSGAGQHHADAFCFYPEILCNFSIGQPQYVLGFQQLLRLL